MSEDQWDRTLMRLTGVGDEKLQPILGKLLPLVFDDLLSQSAAAARNKIVNILNHALTRVKGNTAIQLPVLGIAERWFGQALASSPNAIFFRNLSLIFLDIGVPRLTPAAQIELTLYVLQHFGKLQPGPDRVAMFLASLPGLGQIASADQRKDQVPKCLAIIKEATASGSGAYAGVVAFFQSATEFLLIPCGSTQAPSVGGMPSASWSHWKARLKSKVPADMIKLKTEVLKWLGALGAEPPAALIYLPSLVASVENYDAVCSIGENNCARLDPELNLGKDEAFLGKLICAVLTNAPPGKEAAGGAFQVEPKANVPTKLRHKVLMLLQRAKGIGSCSVSPYVVHLISQSLREHEQVQTAALQLALVFAENVDPESLTESSAAVLQEVEAVFWPGGGVVAMGPSTPMAFRVYGAFTRKMAEHPGGAGRSLALGVAPRMLLLLAANERAAQDILEALAGLVTCMRGATESEWRDFVPLLDKLVVSPKAVVRREVLRWATALFPATSAEGRYYALRLFGDPDPDVARAAENALSTGRREAPPFIGMCAFLAARALDAKQASGFERLQNHRGMLCQKPLVLPPLSGAFTRRDVVQGLSFLLGLAEADGLASLADASSTILPPAAKKPRLESEAPEHTDGSALVEATLSFVALLDYALADALEGGSAAMTDVVADGATCMELGLRGLLLSADIAGGNSQLLQEVAQRSELVLFAADTGTLFREGGATASRVRRIGARIAGTISLQFAEGPGDPTERWLGLLMEALAAPAGSARRGGAALGICEMLRSRPQATNSRSLCQQVLRLLDATVESDLAVMTAVCDGLRRLSERHRLVWDAIEAGSAGGPDATFAGRGALLDRVYALSQPAASGLGDIKEVELGAASRDLVQASWRLLGQLAAWGDEESRDCVDRLVSIGLKMTGEEATAAVGLALAAATHDPAATSGSAVSSRTEALLKRLIGMAEPKEDEGPQYGNTPKPMDDTAKSKLAERETERRCSTVWLAVLLKRLCSSGAVLGTLEDTIDPMCRCFVRSTGDTSMFVADTGLKALCYLYRLAASECRPELMKTMFASFSNRTTVNNMFVAKEKEKEPDKAASGPDSLKITAKERMESLKDLIFLSRELHHPPFFVALLDQPAACVWTGEVFREALDLQAPCLPDDLREHLCPTSLRPKLYPPFFHPIPAVRQAVVALSANYYSCETPQKLVEKFSGDWSDIATHLVSSLGSARVTTREASISAALVLFRGKAWAEVSFIFEDFWTIVIRLMDDMEEKIQVAIKPLLRMIKNLTLRVCDVKVSKVSDVEEAMKVVLPRLLYFCETYKHAQPLCFDVLRDLVKAAQGTQMMSPYVQDLIPPLMISLSMMENSQLQYYQFHVNNASEEKGRELEAARISASRDSDSMKLLRQLVPLVTAENAEELAPKTRDLLHRGVGANTRVGVCDFWVIVTAEKPSAVPVAGKVANAMLRSVAGALLDSSRDVRSAAASCFASFARRSEPQELTKVVFEKLLTKDQEYRTDDNQRNSFRIALARALAEVCRRCEDGSIETELRAAIAAKAFGLRYSEEQEVKTGWELLWNEVCPTISGGIERYYREICAELAICFGDSISRSEKTTMSKAISALCVQLEKMLPKPKWNEDASVTALHKAVLTAVQSLPVFDGIGQLVKALGDLAALLHRRKRGEEATGEAATEESTGLTLVLSFCSKGSLTDRASAVRSAIEVILAARLWGPLEDMEKLYKATASRVDELELEVLKEEREPGEPVPKRHRGKMQSPAEDLLTAVLDLWTSTIEQCRREVEDEGDLDPPEVADFTAYVSATLTEFAAGSLTMRIGVVRMWKRIFAHLATEKIAAKSLLALEVWEQVATAVQDASLDQRSERLRRPALDFAASLVKDTAAGGGRESLGAGLAAAAAREAASAAPKVFAAEAWLAKLDPTTAEQEAGAVAMLRNLVTTSA